MAIPLALAPSMATTTMDELELHTQPCTLNPILRMSSSHH
jgi:hypothetical protein